MVCLLARVLLHYSTYKMLFQFSWKAVSVSLEGTKHSAFRLLWVLFCLGIKDTFCHQEDANVIFTTIDEPSLKRPFTFWQ